MLRHVFVLLSGLFFATPVLYAQQLSFSEPARFMDKHKSDQAPHLAVFQNSYYMAWKGQGHDHAVYIANLGSVMTTGFAESVEQINGAETNVAPSLCVAGDKLYIWWLTRDRQIGYAVKTIDGVELITSGFLSFDVTVRFEKAVSAVWAGERFMIACRYEKSKFPVLVTAGADNAGLLQKPVITTLHDVVTDAVPSITFADTLSKARICWKDKRDDRVYFSDIDPATLTMSLRQVLAGTFTKKQPEVHTVFKGKRLLYLWQEKGRGNSISFRLEGSFIVNGKLPSSFFTHRPVSIANIDDNNFLLVFTGKDGQFYLSYFADYSTASWIGDLLFPEKKHYRLGDIVIPGAHDAGMSVLNGVGGKDHKFVNRCNTLTQSVNVARQLNAGIRMFDLRIGQFKGELYTKHSPANCMEESRGGGWGEELGKILDATRSFLDSNRKEFVILNFSHFCDTPVSIREQARFIQERLGERYLFPSKKIFFRNLTLEEVAGKAIVLFENHAFSEFNIDSSTIADKSSSVVNYRREYAATNDPEKMINAQQDFFHRLKGNLRENDLVRLDWQLTETGSEAALVCNDFHADRANPLVDGILLLSNIFEKGKSILHLSFRGNRFLIPKVQEWIAAGMINSENKPNILYVDAAGNWITDFCIDLNRSSLYTK
jgi:hypothetical protein